jgi:uncharacterized protein YbaP (TraB family)
MSELELKIRVIKAEERIQEHKKKFFSIRRELDDQETLLVEAREVKRRAEDELYEFNRTKVCDTSLEDERTRQIEDYRSRMDASLKSIDNEPRLPYKMMTDLNTLDAWPKSRHGNETDSNLDD